MPKGIPGPNVTMNSGRRAVGSPIAKSGSAPRSLGSSAMNQAQDSGGGNTNFEPKGIKSNTTKLASKAPITGMIPGTVAAGYLRQEIPCCDRRLRETRRPKPRPASTEERIAELEQTPFRRTTEETGNCCSDAHMELEWMYVLMPSLGLKETRTKKGVITEIVWKNERAETAERERDEARAQVKWWTDHAVVILDEAKGLRCYLKGDTAESSMCNAILAENRRLKGENAASVQAEREQCAEIARNPKLWKKLCDKRGKDIGIGNLTTAGQAIAAAISALP